MFRPISDTILPQNLLVIFYCVSRGNSASYEVTIPMRQGLFSAKGPAILPGTTSKLKITARHFMRNEDGNMLIFGVYVFVLILMVGGIGIDLMRYERDRSELQYTLDRAVLAAADLEQTLDPQAVVEDYFSKAGLSDYLASVSVSEGLGYRVVSAQAQSEVETQFMHMNGIETLDARGASTAEERIDSVEISLVLDVSGSMGSNSKIQNLKVAAKEFVDTMVDNTEDGKMSISIVPYATQVSASESFLDRFNITRLHDVSNCVNFTASDYTQTAITPAQPLDQTMHFDPWNTSDRRDNGDNVQQPVCFEAGSPGREMLVMQKDRTTLKDFIDDMYASGNTSIEIGMKWGTALLDPAMRPIIGEMVNDGEVDAVFQDRPYSYDTGDVLKVVVLMTDGQNTTQYYLNDDYREGQSNIWWNEVAQRYSVYTGLDDNDLDGDGVTNEPIFYWPFNNTWRDHAFGEGTYEETTTQETNVCESYRKNGSCRRYQTVETTVTVDEEGTALLLSYAELWAQTPVQANVRMNYEPWMNDSSAWNDWYYDVVTSVEAGAKNSRAYAICDAAKAQDIIVFTIGFEAPSSGRQVLMNCASSDAHFFDVNGTEIADAFSSIATSIRKLRLTQ